MALINRISRLVKADFHAVLDQIEEPAQLLRQAIREMDDELALAEQRIARGTREQALLADRFTELQADHAASDEQLDLCFASGNEDLARKLVRRRLQTERQLKQLRSAQDATARSLAAQREALQENRATLQDLQQKAALFAERAPGTGDPERDSRDFGLGSADPGISDDEVEIAFLSERSRRAGS
jgi:phage shock protein A